MGTAIAARRTKRTHRGSQCGHWLNSVQRCRKRTRTLVYYGVRYGIEIWEFRCRAHEGTPLGHA